LRDENIRYCDDLSAFHAHWGEGENNPGWLLTPWQGSPEQEEELAKQHKITIRCLPLASASLPALPASASCLLTGAPTTQLALWARSY
jgi:prolyl-tRNA synthetase